MLEQSFKTEGPPNSLTRMALINLGVVAIIYARKLSVVSVPK